MRIISVFTLGLLLLSSCVCRPSRSVRADKLPEQAAVERRLNEIFDAAAKKDFARLDSYHLYGPEFTKFSPGQGRQDASLAREGEHKGLGAVSDLTMRADGLKIDVFGGTAIATFDLAFGFTAAGTRIDKKEHGTLVFVNTSGEWKIVHEHFSAVPPAP